MKNWKLSTSSFIAFEKTGIIPRSIYKFFKKILHQLDPLYEYEVLKNFRISKYQTLVFFRYTFTILFIPFLLCNVCKRILFVPLIDRVWDQSHLRIFLNTTQERRAYEELQQYHNQLIFKKWIQRESKEKKITALKHDALLKKKSYQLAKKYIQESKNALANILTDISAGIFFFTILLRSRRQFLLFRSFIEESFYGFSETARAFLIIIFTDVFVGFHSSHGWEVFLEFVLRHFGLPENRDFIFTFVATLPVILDAIFKYWIFRYLNRFSPSTVATYKTMNE